MWRRVEVENSGARGERAAVVVWRHDGGQRRRWTWQGVQVKTPSLSSQRDAVICFLVEAVFLKSSASFHFIVPLFCFLSHFLLVIRPPNPKDTSVLKLREEAFTSAALIQMCTNWSQVSHLKWDFAPKVLNLSSTFITMIFRIIYGSKNV